MKFKNIVTGLAILFFSFSQMQMTYAKELTDSVISTPAEWEAHESIWLAWPQYEPIANQSNIPQILDIIAAVTPYEYVDLIVNDEQEAAVAQNDLQAHGVEKSRVRMHFIPHTDFWMRDMGAIFVSENGQRKAIAFNFNGWGMSSVSDSFKKSVSIDANIATLIAHQLNIPIIKSSLVMEGGGLEFNGQGTLIVAESVIFQPERNPGLTKTKAEQELKRLFGVSKIIWLGKGMRGDDSTFYGPIEKKSDDIFTPLTTNGHTDEFVRWISDDTVLLAEVTLAEAIHAGANSIPAITRLRLEENARILKNSTNEEGKPLKVIRIPVPEDIFKTLHPGDATFDAVTDMVRSDFGHEGSPVLDALHQDAAVFVAATSYLNYLVTNHVVLMPKYWKPGYPGIMKHKDETAKKIIASAFPDREIIQIDNMEAINIGGGGIHCITQQMPRTK